jgi:para-nitrobenzyl esterase
MDGIATFKGIPYAAPPCGQQRFRPPQPMAPWDGVRDALHFGPTAPKTGYAPPFDVLLPEPTIPGEDYLNLNIWTPDIGGGGLPVLVWIHGGAFQNGSGAIPTHDGSRFARDGVVCVSFNYRLGPDGFLYVGEGTANLGLLDQMAALEWVQENIAAFGGDPSKVTIFGESAGGMSATTLLAMPRAAGLFRRVIAQSGAGHHALSLETSRLMSRCLSEKLGVDASPAALASVPYGCLIAAQVELGNELAVNPTPEHWREVTLNLMPFEPVIDGDVLPDLPIKQLFAGAGTGVDVLVGTTTEEYRLFTVPPGLIDQLTDEALAQRIAAYGLPHAETLHLYHAAAPEASAGDLFSALVTDWFYRIPAIRMAEARVAHAQPAYMYEFAWRSPRFTRRLGACHALELPFVFDNLQQNEHQALTGPGAPQAVADAMHAAWVAFATSGDPGWPRYDLTRRATMRFNLTSEVVDDPHAAERVLWEGRR